MGLLNFSKLVSHSERTNTPHRDKISHDFHSDTTIKHASQ
jgi:hypothetical protein